MDLPHWRLHKLVTTGRTLKPSSDKSAREMAIPLETETDRQTNGQRGSQLEISIFFLLNFCPPALTSMLFILKETLKTMYSRLLLFIIFAFISVSRCLFELHPRKREGHTVSERDGTMVACH